MLYRTTVETKRVFVVHVSYNKTLKKGISPEMSPPPTLGSLNGSLFVYEPKLLYNYLL